MKVQIRRETDTDKEKLHEMVHEKEVARQFFFHPFDVKFPESLDEEGYGFTILADGRIVGEIVLEDPTRCGSTYTVGFFVSPEYWGKGICTEALKQIVKFAFDELKIHKIHSDNDSDNPASGRVLEKAGFKKEGVFKEHNFKEGKHIDIIHWGIIRK